MSLRDMVTGLESRVADLQDTIRDLPDNLVHQGYFATATRLEQLDRRVRVMQQQIEACLAQCERLAATADALKHNGEAGGQGQPANGG